MPFPPLLAAAVLAAVVPESLPPRRSAEGVFHGRRGELDVAPPRVEAEVQIDGLLTEAAWARAARLTGFSRFQPTDGQAATDSTEVLVWYSPTAIHFGVRAFAPAGTVNATLADRDRIGGDDHVTILLSTFDDARQAVAFAVNPLGIQMDGTLVETGNLSTGGLNNSGGAQARENVDLSADFVYQSKGRVTADGYEVEIRIPFKSLRYQPRDVQRWGINVLRRVTRLGAEDSWAPARRGMATFLGQGGRLTGLTDLRRGLVLDLTPVVTQRSEGRPLRADPNTWDYRVRRPEVGGNVRWGVTNNLTLNGTVRPDFSQVEADAAQVQFDPRSALFFPERRPFFLDGIEQFSVPSNLIYTRRIVQPSAAVKLTGKVAGTDVAVLSAVDDPGLPRGTPGRHPVYNIVRVQRDVGAQSRVGAVVTDREADGGGYNRVGGLDTRIVFGKVYALQAQLVGSQTRADAPAADGSRDVREGPLWQAVMQRNGRRFGFRYSTSGIHPDFVAGSGFISRGSIARAAASHRVTFFNAPTSRVMSYGGDVVLDGTWKYRDFTAGREALEKKLHFNGNAQLRGGWGVGGSVLVEEFRYDPDLYANYYYTQPRAGNPAVVDTVPYVGTPALPNLDYAVTLNTPQFKKFSGNLFAIWGKDENFYEWASSDILFLTLNTTTRPTDRLRIDAAYQIQRFARARDGSLAGQQQIPRVRVEYQLARPVFVRFVGQYIAAQRDSLRDEGRTQQPVFLRTANGFVRAGAQRSNTFRGDVLFSFVPNPGTVFFAGYGSSASEPDPLRFGQLRRTTDGFFLKWSYLFRV
ncbi:DUF5916 domain-containing protein [Roseisolibacter sp. H3M3-2]|uniref:carbohydrate binding family 9 domain-containing protein n=1 Tax=Roseisolibacter sp. H3M3-2 TaxID=3031323 RepID=UPI0023DC9508|nr:DUF5916 domain-containing protein [Roseisolibacter sp. H3M3-2]MDF1504126.1 DUF5916 domain-containing protein [Roseisolibacter sp. H3M3-2]